MLKNRAGMQGKDAAELANSTFGGQNLVRMARAPWVQDALRATTFAPDWWEGILKTIGRVPKGVADIATGKGVTTEAMSAKQLAVDITATAVVLEGLQLLLTGHTTADNQEGHKWELEIPHSTLQKIPATPSGTPGQMDHIDLLAWRRPVLELAQSFAQGKAIEGTEKFLGGRASTAVNLSKAALTNEDYAGRPIVPAGTSDIEKLGAAAGYAGEQVQPMGTQNLLKAQALGGPAAAATNYLTGFRISSETPLQESQKDFYLQQSALQQKALDVLKQQPEYKSATPAEKKALESKASTQVNSDLRSRVGMPPANYGQPQRYVGVTDPQTEQAINDAKRKDTAHKADPRGTPALTAQERVLLNKAETPQYKKWAKERNQTETDVLSRIRDALSTGFKAP